MKKIAFALGALSVSVAAHAQVNYSGGFYFQGFDTLASTGTNIAWTDNSTIQGWHMRIVSDPTTALTDQYTAGTGSSTTGAVYSFGVAGANPVTDRALGSVGSGTVEHAAYGVQMRNTSNVSYNEVCVFYTGEQWRNGGNASTQSLAFSYDVAVGGGGSIGNDLQPTSGVAGYVADPNYTAVSGLNFNSLINTTTAATLDGNAAGNNTGITLTFTLNETWDPGEDLWLRWVDVNDPGNDHGLSIDNLEVCATPVPEPATMIALAVGGLGVLRRRMKKA